MELAPDTLVRIGCVILAILGLLVLMLAMVRFEQHRPGRVAALVIGAALVIASMVVVIATS